MNEVMELKEKLEKALLDNILLTSQLWKYKKEKILYNVVKTKIEKGKTYTSIVQLNSEGIIYNYDIPALYDIYTKEEILKAVNEFANVEEVENEKDA